MAFVHDIYAVAILIPYYALELKDCDMATIVV